MTMTMTQSLKLVTGGLLGTDSDFAHAPSRVGLAS